MRSPQPWPWAQRVTHISLNVARLASPESRFQRQARGHGTGTRARGGVGGLSLEKALPAHVSGGEGTGSRRGMGTRSPETRPDLPSPPPTECLLFFLSIGRVSHTFWGAASGSLPFAESLCTIIYGFLKLKRANKTQS